LGSVYVYAYLCSDTIEERIEELLLEKRALFADVIDGVDMAALRRLDLDVLLGATKGKAATYSSHRDM
jgi:SNF2 family DNA or RNA helicase